MIYLTLYWSFVQIGLFSIGGGYAALPLIQQQVIEIHNWLTFEEFTDLLTISQMTPGPIALNASTFVGTKIAGLPGAVVATIGCVTPSCIIVLILAYFYYKYRELTAVKKVLAVLRPVVVALIGTAGASIVITAFWGQKTIGTFDQINKTAVILFVICFAILEKLKLNPVTVIILSGIVGIGIYGGLV